MFKITIVDLATGKTELDVEASAICAGIQVPSEDAARSIASLNGVAMQAAYAIDAAKSAIANFHKDPRIEGASAMLKIIKSAKSEKED